MTLHYRRAVEGIAGLDLAWNGWAEQGDEDGRVGTNLGFRGCHSAVEEPTPEAGHGLDSGGHATGGGSSLSRADGGE